MIRLLAILCLLVTLPAAAQKTFISQSAGIYAEGGFFGDFAGDSWYRSASNASITVGAKYSVGKNAFHLVPQIGYSYFKSGWDNGPGGGAPQTPIYFNSLRWGVDIESSPLKIVTLFTGPCFWHCSTNDVHKSVLGPPPDYTLTYKHYRVSYTKTYWRIGAGVNLSRFSAKVGYQFRIKRSFTDSNFPLFVSVGYNFWQK